MGHSVILERKDDMARFARKKYGRIYSASTLNEYSTDEIADAYKHLVALQGEKYQRWHWMYQTDVRMLTEEFHLQDNEAARDLRDILQASNKFILLHEDVDDLIDRFLGVVYAYYEWKARYNEEAGEIKQLYRKEMMKAIEDLANALVENLNTYFREAVAV